MRAMAEPQLNAPERIPAPSAAFNEIPSASQCFYSFALSHFLPFPSLLDQSFGMILLCRCIG